MIDFLKGKVVYSTDDFSVIEINSIGVKVFTPYKLEGDITLYTKMYIKDEEPVIYGFKTREERDLFERITSVSGIGVKHAFSLIRNLSSNQIIDAIESGDISVLSSVPGIGKKTAQRLILELRGKIDFYKNEILEDAVQALESLGFDKKEAIKAVRDVLKEGKTLDLQEVIKKSLVFLTGK